MGNANSGRKPKPTALKILQGNPGQRKLNEHEPKPPQGPVEAPEGLSAPAARVWLELAPIAQYMGTLTPADTSAFASLCELQATMRAASAQKDTEGFSVLVSFVVTDSAGQEHLKVTEHPAVKLERNTAAALRPYYERFGLDPVGRARISVPKQEPVSKWAGMLG